MSLNPRKIVNTNYRLVAKGIVTPDVFSTSSFSAWCCCCLYRVISLVYVKEKGCNSNFYTLVSCLSHLMFWLNVYRVSSKHHPPGLASGLVHRCF